MSITTNISQNKVFRLVVGTIVVVLFLIMLMAAAHKQVASPIVDLQVVLNNDEAYSFLQKGDIEQLLLKNREVSLRETSINQLDLRVMEQIARTHPWVADANVFVDGKRQLQVHIEQRKPVARIFDNNGKSYYVDNEQHEMPSVVGYNYPAPVFTNVPIQVSDSMNRSFRKKIIALGSLISADTFWNAQITQIEVQPDQTFVLIPMIGHQRILFGDTSNAQAKLNNLFDFYQQVSKKIGWDKYQVLDLRYQGQIVATPSIGWVAPKILDTTTHFQQAAPVDTTTVNAAPNTNVTTRAVPKGTNNSVTQAKQSDKEKSNNNTNNSINKPQKPSSDTQKEKQAKYLYRGNNQ